MAEFCSLLDTGEYFAGLPSKIDWVAGPSQPSLMGQKPDTLNEFITPLKFYCTQYGPLVLCSKYKPP